MAKRLNREAESRNNEVRDYIRNNGLYMWQVAEQIGIHPTEFSRWLRNPLTEEQDRQIAEAVAALRKGY